MAARCVSLRMISRTASALSQNVIVYSRLPISRPTQQRRRFDATQQSLNATAPRHAHGDAPACGQPAGRVSRIND